MRMLRWICDNIKRDQVQNDDIHKRVTPIEEKLVQHRLRWFKQIQRRLMEAPVHNDVIRQFNNEKRERTTKLNIKEVRKEI
jgi:signal recognition particle GTPase